MICSCLNPPEMFPPWSFLQSFSPKCSKHLALQTLPKSCHTLARSSPEVTSAWLCSWTRVAVFASPVLEALKCPQAIALGFLSLKKWIKNNLRQCVRRARGWNIALESSRPNVTNQPALIRQRVITEPLAPKLYNWLQFKSVIIIWDAAAFHSSLASSSQQRLKW